MTHKEAILRKSAKTNTTGCFFFQLRALVLLRCSKSHPRTETDESESCAGAKVAALGIGRRRKLPASNADLEKCRCGLFVCIICVRATPDTSRARINLQHGYTTLFKWNTTTCSLLRSVMRASIKGAVVAINSLSHIVNTHAELSIFPP